MAQVELVDLKKHYGAAHAVDGVSVSLEEGTFAAILGPSGCGKTTLLRLLAGLERPTAGRVRVGGDDLTAVPPERRGLGMMFQSYALLPHMTVAENLRFPLRMQRIGDRAAQHERVRWAIDLVQLGGMADRYPRQLSGGQQQRVALARAIIASPRVLLLDEPLSNLDAQLRKDMQLELIELHRQLRLTTVLVTHDQEEALSLADTVVLMRDGRVEQVGSPWAIYRRPATAFAARFLGAANLLEVTVRRAGGEHWVAALAPGCEVAVPAPEDGREGARQLVVRQEDVVIEPGVGATGAVAAEIATVAFQGATCRLVVRVAGQRMEVLAPAQVAEGLDGGRAVSVRWPPDVTVVL
ncbi:MAG: ABC transporter ATP-binding protein [Ectothiorhodospiraceae bacterium]|nr:ABC transporter ATP-binding protein [Chromatiales bacterium]MCP5154124.1 ABC transporter ATP-binding protein [Ectothiorhodospiraceae bacterium]